MRRPTTGRKARRSPSFAPSLTIGGRVTTGGDVRRPSTAANRAPLRRSNRVNFGSADARPELLVPGAKVVGVHSPVGHRPVLECGPVGLTLSSFYGPLETGR